MNNTINTEISELEQKALAGDAKAQYKLGRVLALSVARKQRDNTFEAADNKTIDLAIEWIEKAANQGYVEAQATLGFAIFESDSIGMENTTFSQKQPLCQFTIDLYGKKFFEYRLLLRINMGRIARQKLKERVFDNLVKAAKKNDVMAQYFLGRLYHDKGTEDALNYENAVVWFQKSAENDCIYAKLYLSSMYANGIGVRKDYAQATKHMEIFSHEMDVNTDGYTFNLIGYNLSTDFLVDMAQVQYAAQENPSEVSKTEVPAWKLLDTLANLKCLDAATQRIQCYLEGRYVNGVGA